MQSLQTDTDYLPGEHDSKVRDCLESFFLGFRPPPDLWIWEWADEFRMLPKESSDEAGLWRTSRTPYLREIMEELSPRSHATDIDFMKGSQIGATECMINAILFYIAHAPAPILMTEPNIELMERTSRLRIQPSIDLCEQAKKKIGNIPGARGTGNTILQKDFPGGTLIMSGGNSPDAARSTAALLGLFDEIDSYPRTDEGDILRLFIRRTTNFARAKRYFVSTPTIKGKSRIEKRFKTSDQRYYHVPCPHCKHKQVINWSRIKFDDQGSIEHRASTARMVCEKCEANIPEHYKDWMLENGEWVKMNPEGNHPGFHLSALYSPLGWYSWQDAVMDFLTALGDPAEMQTFVNTILGETFDDSAASVNPSHISKRRRTFSADVPERCRLIVSGADGQDDRIEITTVGVGWDDGPTYAVIDHSVFFGDPRQEHDQVWTSFDQHLQKEWRHESGQRIRPACTCMDAMGHYTENVYKFCAARKFRRIFPVQGVAGPGRPTVIRGGFNKQHKVHIFRVGVDGLKDALYSSLLISKPGPGYIDFSGKLSDMYFDQLTAERKIHKSQGGKPTSVWECPSGKRNEALDCWVYSMAALAIFNPNIELLAREKIVYTPVYQAGPVKSGWQVLSKGVTE